MQTLETAVDLLHLFGDPTRVRLLSLLGRHELTVAELMAVTDLGQSRVSTHLGKLRDAGLLRDRRQGGSTVYSLNDSAMPGHARKLWDFLEQEVGDPTLAADRSRAEALLRARTAGWPDAVAGEMERHYSPGRTWEAMARGFLALLRPGDVLDAGAGDGAVASLLAPRARSITCLDCSERMVAAARRRLQPHRHVRVVRADLEAVPAADASFDQVLLLNVLASVQSPARALAEAARVLRPGGALAVVTLAAHEHAALTAGYGHRHPGFALAALRRLLQRVGLLVETCEITSRERREPHFEVVTAAAHKPGGVPRGSHAH